MYLFFQRVICLFNLRKLIYYFGKRSIKKIIFKLIGILFCFLKDMTKKKTKVESVS